MKNASTFQCWVADGMENNVNNVYVNGYTTWTLDPVHLNMYVRAQQPKILSII